MKLSAIGVLPDVRFPSRRWLTRVLILLLALLCPFGGLRSPTVQARPGTGGPAWVRDLPVGLLAVVNTSASRIASWGRVGEEESGTWVLKRLDSDTLKDSRKKGGLGFVDTPRGVLLLLGADDGRSLQLLAVDADTGRTLWSRRALGLTEGGAVTAAGDFVFVLLSAGSRKPAPPGYALVALNLGDGRELWRTPELFDAPTLVSHRGRG